MEEKIYRAELIGEKIIIWDKEDANNIFNNGWYGELLEDRLELALVEAALLLERKKIEIAKGKKNMDFQSFFKIAMKLDDRFHTRYVVYKDLRERGLPVRTGFKFGCDFRVYERGVSPLKKGPKQAHEHTKWVVFCIPENYTCSFQELSRAVRLAHNIRANMLWAIVDTDSDTTYYEIKFLSP